MGRAPTNTKEKLVETAIDLVWSNSYGSVSVDDICKASGVKKGSFYHYFPSKAELAIAALEEHFEHSRVMFDDVFSPSHAPLDRFKKLADLCLAKQEEALAKYGHVCGCPFATLGSEMAGQAEQLIRQKVDELFGRHRRYYESTLRDLVAEGLLPQDTDVAAKTTAIYSYLMGQVMLARIQNSLEPLKASLLAGLLNVIGLKREVLEMV